MNVDDLIDEVIGREGGYSNHPADRGGATRWGVTERVARAHGYRGDMRSFPRDEAVAIYRRIYWIRPGLDRVAEHAPRIAAELIDTGVNMGPDTAAGFVQRALNALNRGATDYPDIAVDRKIGPRTLEALRGFLARRGERGETVLLKAIEALQANATCAWPSSGPATRPSFTAGWPTGSADRALRGHRGLHELRR
ncbi:MAG TPA: glycosyl hydrolase 108 family protein [Allosphingosinicella sp.]|uniref:glycoside hydrolase family 108 protein n=1 Tax=Allosphingosinicella sp. TaxID=2823234 RepID=UPI002F273201